MITKETIKRVKRMVKGQKGQKYPCSNQSVGNYIFFKDNLYDKIEELITKHHFIIKASRRNEFFLEKEGIQWKAFIMKENLRACRAYRAIIDTDFEEDFFRAIILHMLDNYCKEVEFIEFYDNK